jgi:hypothetical protein
MLISGQLLEKLLRLCSGINSCGTQCVESENCTAARLGHEHEDGGYAPSSILPRIFVEVLVKFPHAARKTLAIMVIGQALEDH